MLDAIIIARFAIVEKGWGEGDGKMGFLSFLRGMEFLFSKKAIDFIHQLLCNCVPPYIGIYIQIYSKLLGDGWIFVYICDVCDICWNFDSRFFLNFETGDRLFE